MKRRSEGSSIGQIPDLKIELSKLTKFLGELRTGQGSTDRLLEDYFEKLPERIIQCCPEKECGQLCGLTLVDLGTKVLVCHVQLLVYCGSVSPTRYAARLPFGRTYVA